MTISTTALLPLDPAISPEHANRILPIRINVLPEEITAGRNARRIRLVLVAAVVVVVVVMSGWYVLALKDRNLAREDADSTAAQVSTVQTQTREEKYSAVSDAIATTGTLTDDLKGTLAKDLPWATLLNQLRSTATAKKVTINQIVATLAEDKAATQTAGTVGSLQISGNAADKKTVADFVDAVSKITASGVSPVTNAYLTSATQQTGGWTFTMTADITDDAECGRFTTACKSEGY